GLARLLGLGLICGRALAVEDDVADPDDRQLLAMALLHPPPRLGPVLEADQLLAAIAPQDLARHGRVGDHRPPDRGGVTVGHEEAVDRHRCAGPGRGELDLELRADFAAVLLPAGLDDCVHGTPGRGYGSRGGMPLRFGQENTPRSPEARTGIVRRARSERQSSSRLATHSDTRKTG